MQRLLGRERGFERRSVVVVARAHLHPGVWVRVEIVLPVDVVELVAGAGFLAAGGLFGRAHRLRDLDHFGLAHAGVDVALRRLIRDLGGRRLLRLDPLFEGRILLQLLLHERLQLETVQLQQLARLV